MASTINPSNFATWQTNWEKRQALAGMAGIPQTAVKAVAQEDYNRLLAGSMPLSNIDAYSAMQSVAAGKVQTPDTAGHSNLAVNAMNDARSIFTGIFHIPQALASDVKGAVTGVRQGMEGKGWKGLEQSANQLSQLIPGVTDIEQAAKGNFGYFYQHPLFSLMDLAGTTRIAQFAADAATGARISANAEWQATQQTLQDAGFSNDALSVRPVPTLSDKDKTLTARDMIMSRHPYRELGQRLISMNPKADEFLDKNLGRYGYWGNRVNQIIRPINIQRQMGQEELNAVAKRLVDAQGDLTTDDITKLNNYLVTGHDVLNDPDISNGIKDAYIKYRGELDALNERMINTGLLAEVINPITGQRTLVPNDSSASKLLRDYDSKVRKHEDAMRKSDASQQYILKHSNIIQGPAFNAPVGMEADFAGKPLTAQQFFHAAGTNLSNMDLRTVIRTTPDTSAEAARAAAKRFRGVLEGPLASLVQHLSKTPTTEAEIAQTNILIRKIRSRLSSKYIAHLPQVKQLKDTLDQYQFSLKEVHKKKLLNRNNSLKASVTRARNGVENKANEIDAQWNKIDAAKHEEIITQIMTGKLAEKYKLLPLDRNTLDDILTLLQHGDLYPTGVQPFFSAREFNKIKNDAIGTYDKMIADGAKPVLVPKAREESHAGVVRVGAAHIPSVSGAMDRALNASYYIQNPFFGLLKRYQEVISYERSDMAFEMGVKNRLKPQSQLHKKAEDEWLNLLKTSPDKAPKSWKEYFTIMYKDWQLFDYTKHLPPNSRHISITDKEVPMMIHKRDLELMQKMNDFIDNSATRAWDKGLGVFRNAVLTFSPRFFAHIALGGAFFLLGVTDPAIFRYSQEAFNMVRNKDYKLGMAHGTTGYEAQQASEKLYEASSFHQFHNVLAGNTLGRLWNEAIAKRLHLDTAVKGTEKTLHGYHHFLEGLSDFYRSLAYLQGKAKASRRLEKYGDVGLNAQELADAKNYGLTAEEYAGVKLANKILADNSTRTPLERTIIRFVMPFGGWTKHVLRYVFQFPADHPLRANFLSNLAEQAYEDDKNGLPQYMFHMLFFNNPDINGNVTGYDFRQWNPLRDVANYFTLAGFMAQLNPVFTGTLSAMGINTLTGGPELYPTLTYDSFHGTMQVQQPSNKTPLSLLESYIPEVGALDHFLKLSNYTRSLARFDPAAYRQQLFTSLNFPWMPQHINIKQIIGKQEMDRVNELKSLVTTAFQTNDMTPLASLQGPFPYNGWYFSRGQIKDIIAAANQWSQYTGIPVPASQIISTPYAPPTPIAEQLTPPVTLAPTQLVGR